MATFSARSGWSCDRVIHAVLIYYLVGGIDYTFGQKKGSNEDWIQAYGG
jgi:hypothetical protein